MYRKTILAIVFVLFMVSACLSAQMSNTDLNDRISQMEKELEALKAAATKENMKITNKTQPWQSQSSSPWNIETKKEETKTEKVEEVKPAPVKPVEVQTQPDTSKLQLEKETQVTPENIVAPITQKPTTFSLWSKLDIQFYGYLKLDAAYDSSMTTAGNYNVYVNSETLNPNDDAFYMTANQSRLGFKINGPENDGFKTSGLIEFDFYGNNAAENKAKIQMRHAYMKMNWDDGFEILAGQTSDVISPLVPTTLNYTVLWGVGNIGYRRPQIRLTRTWTDENKNFVKLEAAVARTIGTSKGSGVAPYSETGMDAGYPTAQSRLSMSVPVLKYKPTTIGFSGHLGTEEYDTQTDGHNKKFQSWSANFDLTQPINKWFTIKGEYYTGENVGTYFGGILQSINTTTLKEIAAQGGWIAASLGPWDNWNFNVGYGADNVERGDVVSGSRIRNSSLFGNLIYSINSNTQVGFELSQWDTAYKDGKDADSTRAQLSFIYKF